MMDKSDPKRRVIYTLTCWLRSSIHRHTSQVDQNRFTPWKASGRTTEALYIFWQDVALQITFS